MRECALQFTITVFLGGLGMMKYCKVIVKFADCSSLVIPDPNQYLCQLDTADEKQLIPEASDFIELESTMRKFKLKCL